MTKTIGAVALSAAALWFGTGLHPMWWLTWVAIIPVLMAVVQAPAPMAFIAATAAWFAGGLNMWAYLHSLLGVPAAAIVPFMLLPALFFGVAVLSWRALLLKGALVRATLALPAVWVVFSWLSATFSPHSTFGNIAYSQMDFLPVLQLASVTGLWGIDFFLFVVPAGMAAIAAGPGTWPAKRALGAAIVAAFGCAVLWGGWRLYSNPGGTRVFIGLAAADRAEDPLPHDPAAVRALMDDYAKASTNMADGGVDVVVLPEKLARLRDASMGAFEDPLRPVLRPGMRLVAGVERWTASDKRNEARVYSSAASPEAIYEKHHMLPPFESYLLPGTERTILNHHSGKWGVAICKDMDFPKLSREYGNDGAGLLLVPAWDFAWDGWLHSRMAVMRGVESGFAVARAARRGLLTVSDDRGRVLRERESGSAPMAFLFSTVAVRRTPTLYARFGDWFALLNLALLAAIPALPRNKRA